MTDIIYKLAAHAEALTDLARIRAAQAMLEARDEIVRLRADNARLSAAVLHADQWSSGCPCDERRCPRAEQFERPLHPFAVERMLGDETLYRRVALPEDCE